MSISEEKKTVEKMISIFCRAKHGSRKELCPKCRELLGYTAERLEKCPFGDKKGRCSRCRVHCYNPSMRKEITAEMRFSGPRLLRTAPAAVMRHFWKKLKGR